MRSSTRKYTQQLDGFQVVREDLIVESSRTHGRRQPSGARQNETTAPAAQHQPLMSTDRSRPSPTSKRVAPPSRQSKFA